jgi:hypothetical protein
MPTANQPTVTAGSSEPGKHRLDLRDPWLAALLAWLVPGLGHMYQRRWGKGGLLMTCILATFFYGLWLGGGRVVYASFRENDAHYAYLCQVATGLPALPAIVQAVRCGSVPPKAPLWDGLMAPPMLAGQIVTRAGVQTQHEIHPNDPFFALREDVPAVNRRESEFKNFRLYDPDNVQGPYLVCAPVGEATDQSAYWQYQQGGFYDLGTVFTMIAGLLNVLAIWDAWGGPATPLTKPKDETETARIATS